MTQMIMIRELFYKNTAILCEKGLILKSNPIRIINRINTYYLSFVFMMNDIWETLMKVIKLIAIATALTSGVAMANSTVTDAGKAVAGAGKTLFNTAKNPAAVSLELGTLGAGANVAWSANNTTEVVAGWTGGSFDVDVDVNDPDSIINWDKVIGDEYKDFSGNLSLKTDFSNPYVGVKVRPFANRFTVGTGVIFQDNTIDAKFVSNNAKAEIKVKDKTYTVPVSAGVNVHAESGRSLAPYLTIGFKPNADKRFGMFGEIGAVYTGDWKTRVEVHGDIPDKDTLRSDLQEKVSKDNLAWYPIVKLGATVRF